MNSKSLPVSKVLNFKKIALHLFPHLVVCEEKKHGI